jgi:hypothetical protein
MAQSSNTKGFHSDHRVGIESRDIGTDGATVAKSLVEFRYQIELVVHETTSREIQIAVRLFDITGRPHRLGEGTGEVEP